MLIRTARLVLEWGKKDDLRTVQKECLLATVLLALGLPMSDQEREVLEAELDWAVELMERVLPLLTDYEEPMDDELPFTHDEAEEMAVKRDLDAFLRHADRKEPPPSVERWMVDYENSEGEPQHAVLSWLDDEAKDLPEVGTSLIRELDAAPSYDAKQAVLRQQGLQRILLEVQRERDELRLRARTAEERLAAREDTERPWVTKYREPPAGTSTRVHAQRRRVGPWEDLDADGKALVRDTKQPKER